MNDQPRKADCVSAELGSKKNSVSFLKEPALFQFDMSLSKSLAKANFISTLRFCLLPTRL
jgi:hypothetical protein